MSTVGRGPNISSSGPIAPNRLVMTNPDLFVSAIEEARARAPRELPTGGVDALLRCASDWAPVRLAQECTTLTAELARADQTVLYSCVADTMRCVSMSPPHLESPFAIPQDVSSFPWDLGALTASRFVLVEDAGSLPASTASLSGTTLGELGVASAVHLPLWAGNRSMGAMHLYWSEAVTGWDDRAGALLRAIGVFTLERIGDRAESPQRSGVEHRF